MIDPFNREPETHTENELDSNGKTKKIEPVEELENDRCDVGRNAQRAAPRPPRPPYNKVVTVTVSGAPARAPSPLLLLDSVKPRPVADAAIAASADQRHLPLQKVKLLKVVVVKVVRVDFGFRDPLSTRGVPKV